MNDGGCNVTMVRWLQPHNRLSVRRPFCPGSSPASGLVARTATTVDASSMGRYLDGTRQCLRMALEEGGIRNTFAVQGCPNNMHIGVIWTWTLLMTYF